MNATKICATFYLRNASRLSIRLAAFSLLALLVLSRGSTAHAGVVDFTGINLAQVASTGGQNFGYIEGAAGPAGVLNVQLVNGVVDTLTIGSSPDPTGFYALQGTPQTIGIPFTFSFSFSSPEQFTISENETLTSFEVNTLSVPAAGSLALLSSADAIVTTAPSQITFQGATAGGGAPFGTYTVLGSGSSFDFFVRNQPGAFTLYGSSISINVVPEPSTLVLAALGGLALVAIWRRRK